MLSKRTHLRVLEESLLQLKYKEGSVWGYIEVHIEQGPSLESLGLPLGVVNGIFGQTRLKVMVSGATVLQVLVGGAKVLQELDEMKKRLKEMEDEAKFALREMQAKVEKEMGAVQDPANAACESSLIRRKLILGRCSLVMDCEHDG
ncbi:hypothetical protein IFM89_023205 [Coptis chinensis]|uniref:Uncharacterized protein n=1 Tax=Coptis chinensis TaxID=261450 RepID=A0A835LWW3_9MAGN|nr:hypothetical protein IFM89_023205 [Coptis chinensis]